MRDCKMKPAPLVAKYKDGLEHIGHALAKGTYTPLSLHDSSLLDRN
jgi:hypothetical protein